MSTARAIGGYLALVVAWLGIQPLTISAQTTLSTCCPIVEIRQYTLDSGTLDSFIDLFERFFIEGQESQGITVVGTFRVADDPNKFFWIRGFPDMSARAKDLQAFYYGPIWKAHRSVANPMLVENDNVLLVRPESPGTAFSPDIAARPSIGSTSAPGGLLVATIYEFPQADNSQFQALYENAIRPSIARAGARVVAAFVTEHSANNFPKLPIRDDANVFTSFSCFKDQATFEQFNTTLEADRGWAKVREALALMRIYSPPQILQLKATPRSALHC